MLSRIEALETEISIQREKIKAFDFMAVYSAKEFSKEYSVNDMETAENMLAGESNEEQIVVSNDNGFENRVASEENVFRNKSKGKRIIIESLPCDDDPMDIFYELASVLEIPNMSQVKINYYKSWVSKAGTERSKVILRVSFANYSDKLKFISKDISNKLSKIESSARFHGVQIYPDRTFAERESFKLLLNEAKLRNKVLRQTAVYDYRWIVDQGILIKVNTRFGGKPVK